jgi:hypothetical protein
MAERHAATLAGDTQKIAASMTDDYLQTDIHGVLEDEETWLKKYFIPLAQLIKSGKFRWEAVDDKDVVVRIHGERHRGRRTRGQRFWRAIRCRAAHMGCQIQMRLSRPACVLRLYISGLMASGF